MGARTTALTALIATRRQGAWSDGILKEYVQRDRLDRRDAALASQLVYGVMQNRLLLDFYLSQVVSGPMSRLQPEMLDILRLGAYQILLLDKIPDSAAVNEAVEQTKHYVNKKAAGMTNGCLRALSRQKQGLPPAGGSCHALQSSADAGGAAAAERRRRADRGVFACGQRDRRDVPAGQYALIRCTGGRAGADAAWHCFEKHPWLDGCYLVRGTGNLAQLELFPPARSMCRTRRQGLRRWLWAQSRGCGCSIAAPRRAERALPQQLRCRTKEASPRVTFMRTRFLSIERSAARLGISIVHARQADASQFEPEFEAGFDVVIADVPCSGLGVIRKKPDIRYKDLAPMQKLPQVQAAILENVSRYVKPGGVMVYST